MKNARYLGMIAGIVGGALCVLAGLLSLLLGLLATQQFGSTIPPGLYWALGFYFIGKGIFAAGISMTTGSPRPEPSSSAVGVGS